MNTKTFIDKKGKELIIKHRTSAIIFSANKEQLPEAFDMQFTFTPEIFKELFEYLNEIIPNCWKNFKPIEAYSMGSDYYEYYDNQFESNGYLRFISNGLWLDRPNKESPKLYQFNKAKMQSFMYEFEDRMRGE